MGFLPTRRGLHNVSPIPEDRCIMRSRGVERLSLPFTASCIFLLHSFLVTLSLIAKLCAYSTSTQVLVSRHGPGRACKKPVHRWKFAESLREYLGGKA